MFIPRLLVNLSLVYGRPVASDGSLGSCDPPFKKDMKKVQQYGPFYSKMEKYGHFYVKLGKCGPFLIKTIDIWTILLTNAKYFGPFFSCAKAKCGPF